mgnify:CR=1 FL=1
MTWTACGTPAAKAGPTSTNTVRGGKTLCSLYAKSQCMGFLVIFGKAERAKVEAIWESLSPAVRAQYEAAQTYHDGKWVMFSPTGTSNFAEYMELLALKRRPNRK